MKKISIQGSQSMSIIPCYDGRTLAGVQKVVKDGLSVISIKHSHRNCQFSTDPITKVPQLSCAQGIKARNSFWNLHKPDLRKVKGLECATSESVTQMLKAHSLDNAGKPTYRKKILSLLGSLVTKKTISPTQICVLRTENSWPINTCVLSSVCRETEIKQNGIVGTQTLSRMGFSSNYKDINSDHFGTTSVFENNVMVTESEVPPHKSDVAISFPSPSTTPYYDFDLSHEIIDYNSSAATSGVKMTSSNINHKDLSSQLNISISSHLMSIAHSNDEPDNENNVVDESLPAICENRQRKREDEFNTDLTQHPASIMMQSVLAEMLRDMKDIEDYISAYISSFCILEEEFDNYAAIRSSSEVGSRILNEMQSSSGKDITSEILGDSKSAGKSGQDKFCIYVSDQKPNDVSEVQSQENLLKESSANQNVSSYCYWEDEEGLSLLEQDAIASRHHIGNVILEENNTALVPVRFFDNIWKNILYSFGNDYFLQYECSNDSSIPQYCPSTSMYDPNILEEAETIVQAVDSFLNGCLYTEQSNRSQNIPCKIIELDDGFDEQLYTNVGSNPAIVNYGSKSNHNISNTQAEWNEKCTRFIIQANENEVEDSKCYQQDSEHFLNTPNKKESGCMKSESSSESNVELPPPVDKVSKHIINSELPHTDKSTIEYKYPLKNQITNEKTKKNFPEPLKTDKLPQSYKQKAEKIQFSKVGSPLNVHKTRLCSSEYRGNPNDVSVNQLEENIKTELSDKNSNKCKSRFVHVQEDSNGRTTNNSNYLFSSPNLQLNLTNPLSNEKK